VRGFARLDLQLALLTRMRDYQPGLVEDAIRAAGTTPAHQRAAHRRWQALRRSRSMPPGTAGYEAVLGAPAELRTVTEGGFSCHVRRWPVPEIWPSLAWEVTTDPSDLDILNQWLVRGPNRVAALVTDQLQPWSCVATDIIGRGGRPVDSEVPSRLHIVVDRPEGSAVCTFVWGLLQRHEPAGPSRGSVGSGGRARRVAPVATMRNPPADRGG
jgi:hypothetical protein